MAVISYTTEWNQEDLKQTVTWAAVTQADTASPFTVQEYAENISVDLDGTWGTSSLAVWGNNGGGGAAMLGTDTSTAAWTADAMFSILPRPSVITPTITAGTTHSITIRLVIWYAK